MKKLIGFIALLGLFTFSSVNVASAQPPAQLQPETKIIVCQDGRVVGYAVVTDGATYRDWQELLC